jgi:hypothetical protein
MGFRFLENLYAPAYICDYSDEMKDEVGGISSTFREEQKCIQECGKET